MTTIFPHSASIPSVEFDTFFHPHVCAFIKTLNQHGIPKLLSLATQKLDNDLAGSNAQPGDPPNNLIELMPNVTMFEWQYFPTDTVSTPHPLENVDFTADGAYSIYNWELFFHIPLLIASRLSDNQQFEEAEKWFHYIFNPLSTSKDPVPKCYWNFLPFYRCAESDRIDDLLQQLAGNTSSQSSACQQSIQAQVAQWEQNPFNPHLIARMRLVAYQKTVVMKYLDHLIAWGDQLSVQFTAESINEATQLYVLAAQILGPRPEQIPSRGTTHQYTYQDLAKQLDLDDPLANPLIALENEFPLSSLGSPASPSAGTSGGPGPTAFYFCIPQNDQLLAYWDTVADRLFKIRNCMDIEGVVRELPLFSPPIDPALLVRATALGMDLNSALADINAPIPSYRFTVTLKTAQDMCAEVKAMGSLLLTVLEKRDSEALVALRAGQETSLLKAMRSVRQNQIDEAQRTLEALRKTREVTSVRHDYYQSIPKRISAELEQLSEMDAANKLETASQKAQLSATQLGQLPDVTAGFSGISPVTTATVGFRQIIARYEAESKAIGILASSLTHSASRASILGTWARRQADWALQAALAAKELDQIDKQIAAAEIRAAIAQADLANQDLQIDNAAIIEDFHRTKYTNQDLYGWMVSQTSSVFFQSYKLAYEAAKRAEQAFRFETGIVSSNYIRFGYWDSLRRGLLSGEQLSLDVKGLERAYLDHPKPEFQITKNISLVLSDPEAFIDLREMGQCIIDVREGDLIVDYPRLYDLRLLRVSVTIPCITGSYTGVNCILTLLKSSIRLKSNPVGTEGSYTRDLDTDDPRFVDNFTAVESIATSHGHNDTGMLESVPRDEDLRPTFWGAGAISTWRIELSQECNSVDLDTVSDFILTLSYSARDGGKVLEDAARKALELPPWSSSRAPLGTSAPPNTRMFSWKHEFANEWYRFLNPVDSAAPPTMTLKLTMDRFPFRLRGKDLRADQIDLFLKLKQPLETAVGFNLTLNVTPPSNSGPFPGYFLSDPAVLNGLPAASLDTSSSPAVGIWKFEIDQSSISLKGDTVSDIFMICKYSIA